MSTRRSARPFAFRPRLEELESREVPAILSVSDAGPASLSIATGFNDTVGVNADPTANSPYTLGSTLQGQGASEAGWAAGWVVTLADPKTNINTSRTFEGDGSLFVNSGTNQQFRTWSARQQGLVYSSIRAYVPAQGGFTLYVQDSSGTVDSGTASQVRAYAGTNFILLDGSPSVTNEDTGIAVPVARWFHIETVSDTVNKTWEFYLDGIRYNAPDPLGFRGGNAVQGIDQLNLLVESTTGAYVDLFRSAVGFSATGNIAEGQAATFRVSLDEASATPVSVMYSLTGVTATLGTDFDDRTGRVTFAPGETVKTVTVFTRTDAVAEGNETFTLALSNPSGATIGDGSGVATVVDADRRISPSVPGRVAPNLPFSGTLTALNGTGATDTNFVGTVRFSSTDSNATLPADTTYTGSDAGVRNFNFTLRTTGTQTVTVTNTANGVVLGTFSVAVNAAAGLAFGATPSGVNAGQPISPAVTVRLVDAAGNTLGNDGLAVNLALGANPQGATLDGTTSRTTVGGVATFNVVSVSRPGTGFTLVATSSGLPAATSGTFNVAGRSFSIQAPAFVAPDLPLTLTVTALTASGQTDTLYQGTVRFSSSDSNATLPGDTTFAAGDAGVRSFSLTLRTSGNQTVTVTDTANGSILGTFTIRVNPATGIAFLQQPTNVTLGGPISPAVRVRLVDASGNTLGNDGVAVAVALNANPNGAILGGTLSVNLNAGMATFANLTLDRRGTGYTLVASSNGLNPVSSNSFNAVSPSLTMQGPGFVAPDLPLAVTVTALNSAGQTNTGYTGTVRFSSSDSNATLPANTAFTAGNAGVRGFALTLRSLGSQTVTVTDASNGFILGTFTVQVNAAAGIAFVQQPTSVTSAVAAPISPAVTVRLVDSSGRTLANDGLAITLALGSNPSGAGLTGTPTANTVAGVATFSNLALNRRGTGYTLNASATGFSPVTSSAFSVSGASFSATGPAFVAPNLPTTIVVTAQGTAGETNPNYSGTVRFSSSDANATLPGNTSFTASNAGVRSFPITLRTAGLQTVTVTDAANGFVVGTFAVQVNPAVALAFVQQPTTVALGSAIAPAVTVRLTDASGNTLGNDGVAVTVSLENAPSGSTLGGTLTVNTVGGVATFAGLTPSRIDGEVNLRAASTGLTAATSSNFAVVGQATSFQTTTFTTWNEAAGWRDVRVADVNGDGLDDVAGRTSGGQWWVALSNGSSFTTSLYTTWNEAAGWRDVHVIDVNGDGRADVAGRTSGGQWWVGTNTGTAFVNTLYTTWNEAAAWRDVHVIDVNGDGRADVAGRTSGGQWWVGLNTGTAFVNTLYTTWNEAAGWRDVHFADTNGDGLLDVAGRTSGGQWWVGSNTGSSFVSTLYTAWNEAAGWRDVNFADINGDGLDDVVGRTAGGQWWVGVSTGSAFVTSLFTSWNEALGYRDVSVGDFDGDGRLDVIGRTSGGQWHVGRAR